MKLRDVCCGTDAEVGKDDKLGLQKKFSCWLKLTSVHWLGFNKPT